MYRIFAVACATLAIVTSSAFAEITVTGQGSVSVPPDMATVSVGVVTEAEKANDAVVQNSQKVKKVFSALVENGIDKKCFETTQFTVQPRSIYIEEERRSKVVGYIVVNRISVKVHDLEKLGVVLGELTENGANSIDSINFGVSNMENVLKIARQRATADALERANLYCRSLGVAVGKVIRINEQHVSQPRFSAYSAERAIAQSADVPISAGGEKSVSVSVNVAFEVAELRQFDQMLDESLRRQDLGPEWRLPREDALQDEVE